MTADLYDILGVPKDADKGAVRKAFRQKAKKAHPDAGGDQAGFQALVNAHEVLTDERRRQRYDETGRTDDPKDQVERAAQEFIANGLQSLLVGEIEPALLDLVALIRDMAQKQIKEAEAQKASLDRLIKRSERTLGRFVKKRGAKGPNRLEMAMESHIRQIRDAQGHYADQTTVPKRVLEILADYSFNFEEPPQQTVRVFQMGSVFYTAGGRKL